MTWPTGRAIHPDMAKALEGVDWSAIEKGWTEGATATQLAALHGSTASNIRSKALRKGWLAKNKSATKSVIAKAAKVSVNRAVAKASKRIDAQVADTVEACIRESIELGKAFMQRAKTSVESVEDGNLSGVATIGRAGVDLWRKSLGMDATGSTGATCGISFSFVMRPECNATVQQFGPSTSQPVTIDAEEIVPQ